MQWICQHLIVSVQKKIVNYIAIVKSVLNITKQKMICLFAQGRQFS